MTKINFINMNTNFSFTVKEEERILNGTLKDHRNMPVDFRRPMKMLASPVFTASQQTINISTVATNSVVNIVNTKTGANKGKEYTPRVAIWFQRVTKGKKVKYVVHYHHNINAYVEACANELKALQETINHKWPTKAQLENYVDICNQYGFELFYQGKKIA